RVKETGEIIAQEASVTDVDGNEVWFHSTLVPVNDDEDQLDYIIVVSIDVTERKTAEEANRQAQALLLDRSRRETELAETKLEELSEELVCQTQLAIIGKMTASMAHEIRNPLGAVRNAAFLIKKKISEAAPKLTRYCEIIDKEVHQVDCVIRDMLEMASIKEPVKTSFDASAAVREILDRMRSTTSARLELTCDREPFVIVADQEQLRQVVVNILTNSVQAMEGKGEARVELREDREHHLLIFQDNGPGVQAEDQDQLFEPLFTTKAKGAGMGLTLCRQIVERHGGTIKFQDHEGDGALLCVRLPRDGS
ncbi:MAG: ATP-binding protein, partial [Planctomycetales bacterium]